MRRLHGLGLVAAVIGGMAGCGSDAAPPIALNVSARWNDDPGTIGDVGYELWVDFGWPSRSKSCFPAPSDLTVTVDGRDFVPDHRGGCEWDIFQVVPGVSPDAPVDVKVWSSSRVYGEAIYDGLFPGVGGQLIPAGDGTIHAGTPVTVQFPGMLSADPNTDWAQFHWLDAQSDPVPFYTFAPGTTASDGRSFQATVPSITGHASLVIKGIFNDASQTLAPVASTCTGFTNCIATAATGIVGPVSVTVVP